MKHLLITAEENLGNLGYFDFRVKFVIFSGEKGRFGCLLRW